MLGTLLQASVNVTAKLGSGKLLRWHHRSVRAQTACLRENSKAMQGGKKYMACTGFLCSPWMDPSEPALARHPSMASRNEELVKAVQEACRQVGQSMQDHQITTCLSKSYT
jgi:hypothetical protein